jgi:hypothetical protein
MFSSTLKNTSHQHTSVVVLNEEAVGLASGKCMYALRISSLTTASRLSNKITLLPFGHSLKKGAHLTNQLAETNNAIYIRVRFVKNIHFKFYYSKYTQTLPDEI